MKRPLILWSSTLRFIKLLFIILHKTAQMKDKVTTRKRTTKGSQRRKSVLLLPPLPSKKKKRQKIVKRYSGKIKGSQKTEREQRIRRKKEDIVNNKMLKDSVPTIVSQPPNSFCSDFFFSCSSFSRLISTCFHFVIFPLPFRLIIVSFFSPLIFLSLLALNSNSWGLRN